MELLPYILILTFCVILFVILLRMSSKKLPGITRRKTERPDGAGPYGEITRSCPLCGSGLRRGETLHTVVYPGKSDKLVDMYGCPYCYADHPRSNGKAPSAARICPVCKEVLGAKDYLIGRLFEKPAKRHLHILGCSMCRGSTKGRKR